MDRKFFKIFPFRKFPPIRYLMLAWLEGNIFDVALVRAMLPSQYESFVEGSIFIIKVEGFDGGFYLLITTIE